MEREDVVSYVEALIYTGMPVSPRTRAALAQVIGTPTPDEKARFDNAERARAAREERYRRDVEWMAEKLRPLGEMLRAG